VTFEIVATVNFSAHASVSVGDPVYGTYTFDSLAPDINTSSNVGSYNIVGGTLSIGALNLTLVTTPPFNNPFAGGQLASIGIFDQYLGRDSYVLRALLNGAPVDGFLPDSMTLQAYNYASGPNVLGSDALFLDELPLGIFDVTGIGLTFLREDSPGVFSSAQIRADLGRVGPVAASVPLPSGISLAFLGLLCLWCFTMLRPSRKLMRASSGVIALPAI
jgi:hypothetical protein